MMLDLRTLQKTLGGDVSGGCLRCPGPGHSRADRSLSIKLDSSAPDGFLVHSFAGDDPISCKDFVRQKLGLPAFKPKNGGNGRHRASDDEIAAALMAAVQSNGDRPKGRVAAPYNYTDADGALLYQVLRLEPKSFRQRRPDGNGGFIWSLGDVRRVPYRWPELVQFPDATIFLTEGEKDADRVASLGHCATCAAGNKWTDDCVQALAERNIIILQDNDTAGHAKALAAAQALHSTAASIRIVLLPDLPDKGDVSDWLDTDPKRAEKLVRICFDTPEWEPDSADNAGTVSGDSDTTEEKTKPAEQPLPFINIAAWHSVAAPEREWVVKDRVPLKNVTLLSGDGGIGKTILSLHLAAATALARDWLRSLPEPGPALVICCEDDGDELQRRLNRIVEHCGSTFEELSKSMNLISLAGKDAVLAAPNKSGLIAPTSMCEQLARAAYDIQPRLIVIDNSADVFAGNENDRAQVRQFVTLLRGIAINANAGLLLTAHPSLTGINTGTGLSGSTAWNASVRSRLYLTRAKTEKDEEPDPDLRVLQVMKANYGPVGETVTVRWTNGLFLPIGGISNLEKLAAEQKADQTFLTLLDRFNGQGRNTCEKPSAHNYAPVLFAKENEAKEAGIKKSAFEDAMRRLFAANKIRLEPYGAPSKVTARLVVSDQPEEKP
jgi:RecA-family ATPase